MKKLLLSMLVVSGLLFTSNQSSAQVGRPKMTEAQKDSAKAARKAIKAQKAQQAATTTTTPAPVVAPKPAPTPMPQQPKVVRQGTNKSPDPAVGTDAKGRTIYQGPKGGRYTLTAAGNKEYIKKTN